MSEELFSRVNFHQEQSLINNCNFRNHVESYNKMGHSMSSLFNAI